MGTDGKLKKLHFILRRIGSAVIAFSGGVDSVFLAKIANDLMGEKILAITVASQFFPQREKLQAIRMAKKIKIKHLIRNLRLPAIVMKNTEERCYRCKKTMFSYLSRIARRRGYRCIIEGSNQDDLRDLRPGKRALEELNIRSPLQEAGFTKAEIRSLSRKMGLVTWNKPTFSCLATRIAYRERITRQKLKIIEKTELFLNKLGLRNVRFRLHGDIGRIEVVQDKILLLYKNRSKIAKKLKLLGVRYVCLDLEGYRSGSMNEALKWKKKK
jgi:uncharacterized protein